MATKMKEILLVDQLEVPCSVISTSVQSIDPEVDTPGNDQDDAFSLHVNDVACSSVSPQIASIAVVLGRTGRNSITRGAVVQWDVDLESDGVINLCDKTPSHELGLSSHLTCVAGHEEKSNTWGVGSTYGEVTIIDFSVEGKHQVVASSKIGPYTHSEPIASIQWFRPDADGDWTICSVGHDGRIIIWGSSLNYPVRCIPMRKDNVPVIATAMCVKTPRQLKSGSVIVGSAGGSVYFYDVEHSKKQINRIPGCELKWSANALSMLSQMGQEHREDAVKKIEHRAKLKKRKGVDCVAVLDSKLSFDSLFPCVAPSLNIQSHAGEIRSVAVNPFHPNIFLTAGKDGVIKLYDASMECCILDFYLPFENLNEIRSTQVTEALFSPQRETVVVVATDKGKIFVWDISRSVDFPSTLYTIALNKNENNRATSMDFCGKGRDLAVSDASGAVHIIRLPDPLCRKCTRAEKLQTILGLK